MNESTKGLEAGSLFKFCFVGIFIFSISMALVGTVGGYLTSDNWSGPKGVASTSITTTDKTIKNEIDTSKGIGDLIGFIIATPLVSAISAAFIWLFLLVGQYLFTLVKPINLKITEKGLSFGSSLKLCVIGWFFSWVPLALIISIVSIVDKGQLESFKISGEPMSANVAIILSLILIPLAGVICGSVLGISIFIGQKIFSFFRPLELRAIPASDVT